MSKLTRKTQYEIMSHGLNHNGLARGEHILTRLATEHQLEPDIQVKMSDYSGTAKMHKVLLDHQTPLHPNALYGACHYKELHSQILKRDDLDSDHLELLAKHGDMRTRMKVADHPRANDGVHFNLAVHGNHEIHKKILKHANNFYVRNALVAYGNDEIQNHLMNMGHTQKETLIQISKRNSASPETKKRARALYQQVHGEPMK